MKQSGRLFQPEPRNSKAKSFSQVMDIHRNDFHLIANGSIVSQEVISDNNLCSSFKNSDDIELFKILSNEAHFSLSEGILVPRHNLRKSVKVMFKVKVIELSDNS